MFELRGRIYMTRTSISFINNMLAKIGVDVATIMTMPNDSRYDRGSDGLTTSMAI